MRRHSRRLVWLVVVLVGALILTSGPADAARKKHRKKRARHAVVRVYAPPSISVNPATGPDFEVPFACGQGWAGNTHVGHSPSYWSVDFTHGGSSTTYGQPVLASAPGVVVKVMSLTTSYGRYVIIDHGNGWTTLYAHMSTLVAQVGQVVDQGDLIGYVGSTGNSTGPHLHFEERYNGAYFRPWFHRTLITFGTTLISGNCGDRPVTGDWNGDGTSDLGVFRPSATTASFVERDAQGGTQSVPWGASVDRPVVADFDGAGSAQVGVRTQAGGTWQLRSRSGAVATVSGVGDASDAPVTGDWDGNGRDGLGYYHWADHTFHLRADDGSYSVVALGSAGDRPVTGDWNGDHTTDLGVFRPATGTWVLRSSTGALQLVTFGSAGDIPVVGDWNGDGVSDLGVWHPSTGQFLLRVPDGSGGFTTRTTAFGTPR